MPLALTAIVVSYNSATVLDDCIGALRDHLAPEQIIVVDNHSTDDSVKIADISGAEVIANRANLGFGAACNIGARAARHDAIMFLNPDVCVTSVNITALRALTTRRPVGLIAPRTLVVGESGHQEPGLKQILPWPFSVVREAFGPVLPREFSGQRGTSLRLPRGQPWVNGALLLGSRAEFISLGGFDERLFLYYEDMELSRRYMKHGLPISVTDAITGRHALGGSSGIGDGPSAIVSAASALSSIEVVGITHGSRSARVAWILYREVRRLATAALWLTTRGPLSERSRRKLHEFRHTRAAAAGLLRRSARHYPHVRAFSHKLET